MPTARLKTRYLEEIRPALMDRFGYSTPMQAPRISKVTVNMGVGDAKQDAKVLEAATDQLATITGQRPNVRRARKSIAQFKIRDGMPVGVAVTLRGERCFEFLDRLMSVAIPRIRDFRGLSPSAFDGRGNYSLGLREQIIFPEVDYDEIDQVRGLDVAGVWNDQTEELPQQIAEERHWMRLKCSVQHDSPGYRADVVHAHHDARKPFRGGRHSGFEFQQIAFVGPPSVRPPDVAEKSDQRRAPHMASPAGDDGTGESNAVSAGFFEAFLGRLGQLCRHRTEQRDADGRTGTRDNVEAMIAMPDDRSTLTFRHQES